MKLFLKRNELDIYFLIVVILITFFISNNFSMIFIKGSSMSPTYQDGDVVLLKKAKKATVGDIIVFKSPETWQYEKLSFVKRIVATTGNEIEIANGTLKVDGKLIKTNNQDSYKCNNLENVSKLLKSEEYFVMGDNHGESNDSYLQYCEGNEEEFIVSENIMFYGKELFILGGNR